MALLIQTVVTVATVIFYNSLKTSVLIALVVLVQKILGRFLSAYGRYLLWFTVVISLITPVGFKTVIPDSVLSLQYLSLQRLSPQQQALPTPDMQPSASTSANGKALIPERLTMPGVAQEQASQSSTHESPIVQLNTVNRIDWGSLLALLWLAGAVLMVAVVLVRYFRFSSLLHQALPANADLQQLMELCRRQSRCKTAIRLLCSPGIDAPLVTGCFSPVLLLPAGIEQHLSTTQLRHVFMHELMHVKHLDITTNWLLTLLQCLHWFNPLLWFGFSQMRHDRELACDAATLRHLGSDNRQAYGHTLLQLSQPQTRLFIPTHGIGIVDTQSQLRRRISMIVQTSLPSRMQSVLTALLLLAFGGLAFSKPVVETAAASAGSVSPAVVFDETAVIAATQAAPVLASPLQEPDRSPAAAIRIEKSKSVITKTAAAPTIAEHGSVASKPEQAAPRILMPASIALIDTNPLPVAAVAVDAITALPKETYAHWDEIQEFSRTIADAKTTSLQFLAEWNTVADACEKIRSGSLSNWTSSACSHLNDAFEARKFSAYGKECNALGDQYNQLSRDFSTTAADKITYHAVIATTLFNSYRNLTGFCYAQNYQHDYPAYAKLLARENNYLVAKMSKFSAGTNGNQNESFVNQPRIYDGVNFPTQEQVMNLENQLAHGAGR